MEKNNKIYLYLRPIDFEIWDEFCLDSNTINYFMNNKDFIINETPYIIYK